MQHDSASQRPAVNFGPDHGRALDQAIDMLGAMLRSEREIARAERADALKGRLRNAEQPALRARVRDAVTDGISPAGGSRFAA